jgi:superfamily I DNA/RNA helicase
MTPHRAKGLQFDAVILPALDLETGGRAAGARWKVREHDGGIGCRANARESRHASGA